MPTQGSMKEEDFDLGSKACGYSLIAAERFNGIMPAILLQFYFQVMESGYADEEGWFEADYRNIFADTGLSYEEIRMAEGTLRKRKAVKYCINDEKPNTSFFKIDPEALRKALKKITL